MPSKSKSQQRLFGMVHAYQNGSLKLDDLDKSLADKIKKIADGERRKTGDKRKKTKGMTKKAAKDMASTKHEDLPEKVSESKILNFKDFIFESIQEVDIKDTLSLDELSAKHNIPKEYFDKILPIAIEIEMEHTDDPDVALEIALHHLEETPVYYDDKIGLPDMEERLDELDDNEINDIVDNELDDTHEHGEEEVSVTENNTIIKFKNFK